MAAKFYWKIEKQQQWNEDFSADFHAGPAVQPPQWCFLLAGYDVDCFTTGIGVSYKSFGLNYTFRK